MNLVAILEGNTRKSPEKQCIIAGGKSYSFQQIRDTAKRAAGLFQSLGLEKGDRWP